MSNFNAGAYQGNALFDAGAYQSTGEAPVTPPPTRRTRRTGLFFPQPNRLLRTFRGKRPS